MLLSTLLAAFAAGCAAALPSVPANTDVGDSVGELGAHNLTFRDLDTRFTVPNALIDWYADSSKPYENRATWFPSAKVRTDLWIFQPSGAQMRNSVLLQSNLASSETQMSGRWDLPVGYNYQLVLTVAGDKDRVLSRSHTFDIKPTRSSRNAGTSIHDSGALICGLVLGVVGATLGTSPVAVNSVL